MCRGCNILIDGEASCEEYLNMLDEVLGARRQLVAAEASVLSYSQRLDHPEFRRAFDRLHKEIVRLRKALARAEESLPRYELEAGKGLRYLRRRNE